MASRTTLLGNNGIIGTFPATSSSPTRTPQHNAQGQQVSLTSYQHLQRWTETETPKGTYACAPDESVVPVCWVGLKFPRNFSVSQHTCGTGLPAERERWSVGKAAIKNTISSTQTDVTRFFFFFLLPSSILCLNSVTSDCDAMTTRRSLATRHTTQNHAHALTVSFATNTGIYVTKNTRRERRRLLLLLWLGHVTEWLLSFAACLCHNIANIFHFALPSFRSSMFPPTAFTPSQHTAWFKQEKIKNKKDKTQNTNRNGQCLVNVRQNMPIFAVSVQVIAVSDTCIIV